MSEKSINAEYSEEQIIVQRIADELKDLNGVSRLVGGGLTTSITNTVLGRESFIPGIWIDKQDDAYMIGINIRVYFGVNIPQLSYDIQSRVKNTLDNAGVKFKSINISVEGIDKAEDYI